MKANEFVKKFGWGDAIALVNASNICGVDKSIVDIEDLKRLVESWELVEEYGGLSEALGFIRYAPIVPEIRKLRDAIEDVESCCA